MKCPNCWKDTAMFFVSKDGALICVDCEEWCYLHMNNDGDWYLE